MDWGSKPTLLENIENNPAIDDSPLDYKPDLKWYLQWYWDAFWRLRTSAGSSGFAPSPISIQDIKTYCDIQGISDPDDVCRIIDYIQELDFKFISKQMDSDSDSNDEDVEDG